MKYKEKNTIIVKPRIQINSTFVVFPEGIAVTNVWKTKNKIHMDECGTYVSRPENGFENIINFETKVKTNLATTKEALAITTP